MKTFAILFLAFALLPLNAVAAQVPSHIPTWAFDQKFAEGKDASSSDVQRYLTYAESGFGNDKPVRDCRGSGACSSVFYFDPGFVYYSDVCPFTFSKDVIAAASEDWYVHLPGYSDQAHRIQGSYIKTCKGMRITASVYALNQSNPAVGQFFAQYLQRNADNWDYYLMDDTSSVLKSQTYGPGGGFCKGGGTLNGYCTRTQEWTNDTDVVNAHGTFVSRLKHVNGAPMRVFYNGVSFDASGSPRVELLRLSSQFVGAICENCVVNNGTLRANMYAKVLDTMALIGQTPNAAFVEQNTGKSPPGSDDQIAQRLVTTAMAWLGFIDNRTIVFPNLEFNTTNLAVWPENDIYPTQPVQTMRRGNGDLSVGASVWRREFAQCYLRGKPIGPCAAVVNGSSASVTPSQNWFTARLSHAVALKGGDALNGGTVSLDSQSASTSIDPGHALLLVR
ncbi:MAG: hypothetical protein JO322_01785 [Candidatus Eremiobacteraeota bacterium]|nr:hypothetical protein [Candidatus Eremiobacteraeota bacterium]